MPTRRLPTGRLRRIAAGSMVGALSALTLLGAAAPTGAAASGSGRPGPTPAEPVAAAAPCTAAQQRIVVAGRTYCTHGGDEAPTGTPRPTQRASGPVPAGAASCYGDGVSGTRVQAVYAYASGGVDNSATVIPQIRTWAAAVDDEVDASAAETGGERHVRWVTDAGCTLSVLRVVLPATGDDTFAATIAAMQRAGLDRADRKYLMWVDNSQDIYCGIATVYNDDSTGLSNANASQTGWARVDRNCWADVAGPSIAAHELMHNLGGVQVSAPHATQFNHCWDDYDIMCYQDGSGATIRVVCTNPAHEDRYDCNHDDYFSTAPSTGSYLATHWNTADSPFLTALAAGASPTPGPGGYHPLTPKRVFDTRDGTGTGGSAFGPCPPGYTLRLPLAGSGGVPSTGVGAVAVTLTVAAPSGPGYLTAYPDGTALPPTSSVNFATGQTVANLVIAPVGANGQVAVYCSSGSPQVLVDVAGWFADRTAAWPAAGTYHPLRPARLLDTRSGVGAARGPLAPGQTLTVPISGGGSPVSAAATAAVLNVTAAAASSAGYLTVWPTGQPRPNASNVNFTAGRTVPDAVLATIGARGTVSIYNSGRGTAVIADVSGYFDRTGDVPGGGTLHPVTPARLLDTRDGVGAPARPLGPDGSLALQVTGRGGVPSVGPTAVVFNTAVTRPATAGYLTVWPTGDPLPGTSSVNFEPNQTVANFVLATLGGGAASFYNSGARTDVVSDVSGWFG